MFKKLFDFLKPKDPDSELVSEQGARDKTIENDSIISENVIETKINIIDQIVKQLKGLEFSHHKINGLKLFICGNDNPIVVENILSTPEFESSLRLELDNAGIETVKGFIWSYEMVEEPPKNGSIIAKGLYLFAYQEGLIKPKASITALKGELKSAEYILDSSVASTFNIGRGAISQLENNTMHENFIVIKDIEDFPDQNVPGYALNRFVSRAHACIEFYPKQGFVLRVFEGGCYVKENRTRIVREGFKTIDVQNMLITYPLCNGDQIELGRSVILLFKEIS